MAVPVSFYGYNCEDAKVSEGVKENWWRHGVICGFSETDFTEELKKISVSVLVLHDDDDQIVPISDSAEFSFKPLKHGSLKVSKGYPHCMCTMHPEVINEDLMAFIKA